MLKVKTQILQGGIVLGHKGFLYQRKLDQTDRAFTGNYRLTFT
jgi:hypothetical protein